MSTTSTDASKKSWLSTSAKRSRTVCPANGLRSKVIGVYDFEAGSPGIVRKTVAYTSAGSTESTGAAGSMMSIRYCWFGSPP